MKTSEFLKTITELDKYICKRADIEAIQGNITISQCTELKARITAYLQGHSTVMTFSANIFPATKSACSTPIVRMLRFGLIRCLIQEYEAKGD